MKEPKRNSDKFPWWCREFPTLHSFRAKKRKDVRAVIRAIDELRMGCAFLPSGSVSVEQLSQIAEAIRKECSVKEWGR